MAARGWITNDAWRHGEGDVNSRHDPDDELASIAWNVRVPPPMRYAFVVGCPRSGTSWVLRILLRHPQVFSGPESALYPMIFPIATSAGRDRWAQVLARYDHRAGHAFGVHRWIGRDDFVALLDAVERSGVDAAAGVDEVVAGVLGDYARRRRLEGEALLVEKTPNHLYYADRLLRRFPGSMVIEVVRDGRDVCVSMQQRAQRVSWPPRERDRQIRAWVNAVERGITLRRVPEFASRWHVVRYEELHDDPPRRIGDLFAVLSLPASVEELARIAADSHISNEPIRGEGEHVRTGIVGDWRTHFDEHDVALFEQLAGPTARAAGYCI